MEQTHAIVQVDEDRFEGFGDFELGPEARATAVTFAWPVEAQEMVRQLRCAALDWKALAEEFETGLSKVIQMTTFEGGFKKVKKDDLVQRLMDVKAEATQHLDFQIVLVQPS